MYYWTGGRGVCGMSYHRTALASRKQGPWRSESKRYAITSIRGAPTLFTSDLFFNNP